MAVTYHKLFDSYEHACAVFKIGDLKKVKIDDALLCLGRNLTGFFAMDDRCAHEGISLSKGEFKNNAVVCPWHHFHFDINTGKCTSNECGAVAIFEIKIDEEGFFIGV